MGRPSLLELRPELAEEICGLLEKGNYLETAAEASGVSVKTLYQWMRKGAEGTAPYAAFVEAVTRARATAEVNLLETVRVGDGMGTSFGPAKAAAHILAVTRPQRFATRVNVKVREQLREFLVFLEAELAAHLGHDAGDALFLHLSERWLNRQPVELNAAPDEGGEDAGDGSPTTH